MVIEIEDDSLPATTPSSRAEIEQELEKTLMALNWNL